MTGSPQPAMDKGSCTYSDGFGTVGNTSAITYYVPPEMLEKPKSKQPLNPLGEYRRKMDRGHK